MVSIVFLLDSVILNTIFSVQDVNVKTTGGIQAFRHALCFTGGCNPQTINKNNRKKGM